MEGPICHLWFLPKLVREAREHMEAGRMKGDAVYLFGVKFAELHRVLKEVPHSDGPIFAACYDQGLQLAYIHSCNRRGVIDVGVRSHQKLARAVPQAEGLD